MKSAFDRINRGEIWARLDRIGSDKNLIARLKDLFIETRGTISLKEKVVGNIMLRDEVKQGCPISPLLFNVSVLDLDDRLKSVQEGEAVIGMKNIYSISYADDIAIIATCKEGLKGMIKELGKYLEKKGLELRKNKKL